MLSPLLLAAVTLGAADAGTYAGHGAASVAPQVLAKFAAPALPPELAARIQSMLDVRSPGGGLLTPDGKVMVFNWKVTGITQVWRIDGPQHFPVQLTGGDLDTAAVAVSPDGTFIVISRDRNGEENPGLYLQDLKGGPLTVLQHKPGVQTLFDFVSEDSRYVYFHANDVTPDAYALYRWDRQAGTRELLFGEPGLWSVADHQPDGRLLLQKEVGSNMTEYFGYHPKTQVLTPLLGQGEREDYEVSFAAQPGELLVRTPKLSDFRRLYRWKSGQLTPVTPELAFDVEAAQIDPARKRIYYEVNEQGSTRLHVLDAKSFKELPFPKFPDADHVKLAHLSRDGRFVTLSVESSRAPRVTYVYDWTATALTEWQKPSAPEVDTGHFAVGTLEFYPARDGTRIPIWVRRPQTCAEPCPVVVEFHGGPESQARPGFSPYAQLFVDAGFIFVEPNVRGSDGFGKTWLHSDDGAKRLAVITDIEDAAKFIRANWGKDGRPPKVGILGGSYGGYSAQIGMTMFAGAYDAGVAIVGMSNLVTFLENTAPYRRVLRTSEYGDPQKDREALLKLSPITYVDRVKAPLLLIQGASDPRVPAGEAIQIHDALDAKKIPNQLVIFADEGHGARKRTNQVAMIGHSLRFFEQHLR